MYVHYEPKYMLSLHILNATLFALGMFAKMQVFEDVVSSIYSGPIMSTCQSLSSVNVYHHQQVMLCT